MTLEASRVLPTDSQTVVSGVLRVADAVMVAVAAGVAYWWRFDTLEMPYYYLMAIAITVVLSLNALHVSGVYRIEMLASTTHQVVRVTAAWAVVLVTLLALAYFVGITDWFSRGWVGIWAGVAYVGFMLFRVAMLLQRRRWRAQGDLTAHIAVVGSRGMGQAVIRQLRSSRPGDVTIVGVFDDLPALPAELEGVPVRGTVDDLVAIARTERIDEIVLAMIDRSEEEMERVLARLRPLPVNTKLCAHSISFNMPVGGLTQFAGLPLLHVFERPLRGWGGFWKTLEDRVLGLLITILCLPVLGVVALLVKLDSPGPILFRQMRYGFNNNPISVYKFRSMYVNQPADPNVTQARRNDPRITKIGAILRRTSLDELPQLFNVLKGEMSLVGPRPHAVAHNEQYAKIIDGYLGRHRVKPGITGWAQVNGYRGETDTPEKMRMRVQYDLYYIDNWSLLFDLKILTMTGFVGFVNRNAY